MTFSPELEFSLASLSQHGSINRLLLEAFTPYVKALDKKMASGPYPWIEDSINSGDIFVGLIGNQVVGVVVISRLDKELIIDQIGVASAWQNQGIGSWLLEHIEQVARRENMAKISLNTAKIMTGLLRLYHRHGYRIIRMALPTHGDDEHLRIHMTKLL